MVQRKMMVRAAAFLAPSLIGGGTALVIARAGTIAAIAEQLAGHGVIAAIESERLIVRDADEVLDRVLVDGIPEVARFRSEVTVLVERLAARGPVRIYDEMADILWSRGAHDAVIALESLWERVRGEQPFSLLCGGQPAADGFAHERQLEQLLAVAGELAGATTREAIARISIDQGLAAIGAAYGGLWLVDEARRALELVRVSELPCGDAARWRTVSIDADAPLAAVARDGAPLFIESLAEYRARFPSSYERIRETIESPDVAYAMLPLAGDGAPFGVFAVTFRTTRALAASDRAYLSILARQCAHALERVRLLDDAARAYREEREAYLGAAEATRSRDEILAVVSHDLRNPLGTILMGASSLLQSSDPTDKRASRIRTIAERIHRQAERMGRLIGDLVDFAGIQAGRLAIERSLHPPGEIIAAAKDLFGPIAEERGLTFHAITAPGLPQVECDSERAVQVISNLFSNALKVTPRGGEIEIGVEPRDDEIVFFVRDTGPGIDPEELRMVFQRSWRPKQSGYRGAHLGLTIARGIVDAHGGRIWAASEPGAGSTFYFSLASNRNN